jgi:hypothetical protein
VSPPLTLPSLRPTVDANLESAMALLDVIEAELVGRELLETSEPGYGELALIAHTVFKLADLAGFLSKHAGPAGKETSVPR